jgi:hypothetical protein
MSDYLTDDDYDTIADHIAEKLRGQESEVDRDDLVDVIELLAANQQAMLESVERMENAQGTTQQKPRVERNGKQSTTWSLDR